MLGLDLILNGFIKDAKWNVDNLDYFLSKQIIIIRVPLIILHKRLPLQISKSNFIIN